MIRLMIILTGLLSSNFSYFGFKFKTGFTSQFTTYHFTCRGEWLLRMILSVCLFYNTHGIVSRHYLKTNIYINSDQCPTSFKNLKEALSLSSLVIYFFNILTNFRHVALQSARKLNPNCFFRKNILQIKWVSFYNLNVIFMTNLIFPLLSFMFNFFHSCSTFLVQERASKRRLVELI